MQLSTICSIAGLLLAFTKGVHAAGDSAQVQCFDSLGVLGAVSVSTPDPETANFDRQDCTMGSAAADAVGVQYKTGGGGARGRDYTKIANNGTELLESAQLGAAPLDWGCTRDNLTGLIWEVKINSPTHVRHRGHSYAWYSSDPSANGGVPGELGSDTCGGTLPNGVCNTEQYIIAVNSISGGLCGLTNWRMPSATELFSLVDFSVGTGPFIDLAFFPNVQNRQYWTSSSYAAASIAAWSVFFNAPGLVGNAKSFRSGVLLVNGTAGASGQ